MRGEMVQPPRPWELHDVELEEHRNFWMGEEAKTMAPEGLAALEAHIMATMQAMMPAPMLPQPGGPGAGPLGPPPMGPGPGMAPEPEPIEALPEPSMPEESDPVLAGLPTM